MRFLTTAFVLLAQVSTAYSVCCTPTGIWSEWTEDTSTCYDYCGGVGEMSRNRTCLSEAYGCPCIGPTSEITSCDTTPCIYPRNHTCFPPKDLMLIDNKLGCGIKNESSTTTASSASSASSSTTTTPPPEGEVASSQATSTCSMCCPTGGIWGEWTAVGSCSDTCGMCGKVNRTRSCKSADYGCPCTGTSEQTLACAPTPCGSDRANECCLGYMKQRNYLWGTEECMPLYPRVDTPPSTTNCVLDILGMWNTWSPWSKCSGGCGMCGRKVRTRTCASQPYGIKCNGLNMQSVPCGGDQCPGSLPCCSPYVAATSYDGAPICITKLKTPAVAGSWSAFTPDTGAPCSDTCGAYGRGAASRMCTPPGSTCSGSFFSNNETCNVYVCLYPRQTCAPGFKKIVLDGKFACGPDSTA